MDKRVVITGMGVLAPEASNLSEFRSNLIAGRSGIQYIEALESAGFGCCVGGVAKMPEKLPEFFKKYHLDRTSDYIQLACLAGVEAWEHAGLEVPHIDSESVDWDTGIILGSVLHGLDQMAHKLIPYTNSGNLRRLGSYTTLNVMGSGASAHLTSILACGNGSRSQSAACVSGTDAIVEAYYRIRSGRAKRMVAGGSEGFSPFHWAHLDAMRLLNRSMNDRPMEASRPMSSSSPGFVPSSASGLLVLEELGEAQRRGANILVELKAGFSNCGGQRGGGSLTFPNREGFRRCLADVVKMSGVPIGEVDLINGHLTGTKADVTEIELWKETFSGNGEFLPTVNSTKSLIGHSLGGAGGVESIACILQIVHDFIHPSINCEDLHPEIAEMVPKGTVPHRLKRDANVRTVLKANFGFGDVNSALLFQRWPN